MNSSSEGGCLDEAPAADEGNVFNPFVDNIVGFTNSVVQRLSDKKITIPASKLHTFISQLFTAFHNGLNASVEEAVKSDVFKAGMKEIFKYLVDHSESTDEIQGSLTSLGQFGWTITEEELFGFSNELYRKEFEISKNLGEVLDKIQQYKGWTTEESFISYIVGFYRQAKKFDQIKRIYNEIQELDSDVITKDEYFFCFIQPFVDTVKVSDSNFPTSLVQQIQNFKEGQDLAEQLIIKYVVINYSKLAEPNYEEQSDSREPRIQQFTKDIVVPFISKKIESGETLSSIWKKVETFMVKKIEYTDDVGKVFRTVYARTPYAQIVFDSIEQQFSQSEDVKTLLGMAETMKNAWLKPPVWIGEKIKQQIRKFNKQRRIPAITPVQNRRVIKLEWKLQSVLQELEAISKFYEKRLERIEH